MALSQKNLPGRVLNKLKSFLKKEKDWQDIEHFDYNWESRVAQMAAYIIEGKSVLDLGCGKMFLKKYLSGNPYFPVDYKKRGEGCIVNDFNKHQFPEIAADISFISGCLEYIKDYKWFISCACRKSERIILSYCTTDEFPEMAERKSLAWVNHLSSSAVINFFKENHFKLLTSELTKSNNSIFVFDRQ